MHRKKSLKEKWNRMWNKLMNHDQTLEEIFDEYEEASQSFKDNYLPAIERTSNGTIFIQNSNKFIVPNIGSEAFLDSYIFLDENHKPVHESYGDYAELPKHGYLLKVRSRRPYTMENMDIQYIIDIEHVRVMQSMESMDVLTLMFISETLSAGALSMEEVFNIVEEQKKFL